MLLSAPVRILDWTYTVYGLEGDKQFAAIAAAGIWGEFPLEHLRHLVFPGALAVDIGAYAGLFSLACAQLGASVIAFEGSVEQHRALCQTAVDSDHHILVVQPTILGNGAPVAWTDDTENRTSSHAVPDGAGRPSRRLDDYELSPTLIKIDAEGMEPEILRGASETMERARPLVLCEFNSYAALTYRRQTPEDVLTEIIRGFPYVYYFKDRQGDLRLLKSPEAPETANTRSFLAYNYLHGMVDDLLCAYRPIELPPLPGRRPPSLRRRLRHVLGRAADALRLA